MSEDAAALDETKRTLRARMRVVRASVAADRQDRARRSATICARVNTIIGERTDAQRPRRALVFEALSGEPDVAELVAWCAANEVDTYVPEVDGEALRVMPGNLDPALLDVVIVPGLAFTADGRRLGQGGGHYDRLLARVRPDCLRIGVAFREQLVDDVPTWNHDVAVDVVITD